MRRGFSSLTDLYLNADFYVDEKDEGLENSFPTLRKN